MNVLTRFLPFLTACCLLVGTCITAVAASAAEPIHIKAITGLHYDITQFEVKPGDKVTVVFENTDTTDMPHNFVITKPGGREAAVNAALALGADGLALGYVPKIPEVLWSIAAVMPEQKKTLTFTAPVAAGIYPYVCTYPGHGFIMFGNMYVGVPMPAAVAKTDDGDEPVAHQHPGADGDAKSAHAYPMQRPTMYRTFMPNCGPAAIAVALPGTQNYCWDAGQCRFRYTWSGGFVENTAYWKGNGNGLAKLLGPVTYTATTGMPLRVKTGSDPVAAFKGYQLIKGLPEFHYTLDGIDVREAIRTGDKDNSLVFSYVIDSDLPLFYRVDPEHAAWFNSSAGPFTQGLLAIPAKGGRSFTVTLTAPTPSTGAKP